MISIHPPLPNKKQNIFQHKRSCKEQRGYLNPYFYNQLNDVTYSLLFIWSKNIIHNFKGIKQTQSIICQTGTKFQINTGKKFLYFFDKNRKKCHISDIATFD